MINQRRSQFVPLLLLLSTTTLAQDAPSEVRSWLQQRHASLGLTAKDATDWTVTSTSADKKGVTYLYIEQMAHGLPVHGAVASFAVRSGEMVSFGNRLRADVSGKTFAPAPALSAVDALRNAAEQLELPALEPRVLRSSSTNDVVLDGTGISHDPIPARLIYEALPDGRIALAWDLTIRSVTSTHWWHLAVDAHSGKILRNNDYIVHCAAPSVGTSGYRAMDDLALAPSPLAPPPDGAEYRVFPFPTESPSHGPQVLVTDPADPLASPFGWHDQDGVDGAESTITQGNNVYAFEDIDNDDVPGYSPEGGASLTFDFPFDPPQAPQDYLDAAITNLFYSCNVLHDVWYHYGFDEESGNFQAFNASGQGAENDAVMAQAQDGGGMNNANFGTPPDGEPGQMQMYLWRTSEDSTLVINSPEPITGPYLNALAGFGPTLPESPLTADIVLVMDDQAPENDACEFITNGAAIAGHVALVDRGLCTFVSKVLALQDAGALAVIVVNNISGEPITMGGGGGEAIVIPSVMISQADGATIKQALLDGPVNGTLQSIGLEQLRDCDFDNGVIAHEYGHGVSTRLTGGPADSDCLWNAEQMGEGWSDWMGMMLTMRPGDNAATIRGVGTFVQNQETDGTGIRPAPYSTDPTINDYTYGATNDPEISEPHGIGFIWATMLWDLNWALIDAYGWDADVYNGNGGNNMAIQLMMDGLKLQPCSPGFVDGRDAILRADTLNFDAANACLIWNVFAHRGLGFSADQGDPFSRFDQTEAFDLPTACSSAGLIDVYSTATPVLTLMPNPANDHVTLKLDRASRTGAAVLIHGAEGRLVRSLQWPAGMAQLDLDLSDLAPSCYAVEVRSSTGTVQARLVVQ
jgi:extracellular elastinolytic metalloproteinase